MKKVLKILVEKCSQMGNFTNLQDGGSTYGGQAWRFSYFEFCCVGILFLIFLIFTCSVFASAVSANPYNVYRSDEAFPNKFDKVDEKVLFILDFSQSMTEEIDGVRKVDLMLNTMNEILPTINKNVWVGLRVYGHRNGFTQYDACKASTLLVPITPASESLIELKLSKTNPRGMTPITYSLKRAVEDDFAGYNGKKHIILLTDGGENCDESPCTWVMELVKTRHDVKIDVIAFNISDKDDLDQLQCTALVTTGKFHTANTAAELVKSLQKSLNTNKQVDAKILLNK